MTDKECRKYLKLYGLRAKELRLKKKWSLETLSETSGLHSSVISDIENGKKEVILINRHKLYDGLGVTEYEFKDTPELRAFTGAPAMMHHRICVMAKCLMRCFDK
jgi:transcriptional regulator with XRE-family HTH domain